MFIVLCAFSFYLGGVLFSDGNKLLTQNAVSALLSNKKTSSHSSSLQPKISTFPECGIDSQDFTPCTDPKVHQHIFQLTIFDLAYLFLLINLSMFYSRYGKSSATIASLSWNATVLQFSKGRSAWCLRPTVTRSQSDGPKVETSVGTGNLAHLLTYFKLKISLSIMFCIVCQERAVWLDKQSEV